MLDTIPAWLSAIDSLKWVILALILLIAIYAYRKVWLKWLGRSKTLKIDAFGVKFESEQQQNLPAKQEKSPLDNALNIFRPETMDMFRAYVQRETKYNELPSDKEKFETLLKYSTTLYILHRFEIIYDSIYGSQIQLLQLLNSKGPQPLDIFKHYYDEAVMRYPDQLQSTDSIRYAKFLYYSDLIINTNDQTVGITILGVDFLKYIMDTGKNIYKDL